GQDRPDRTGARGGHADHRLQDRAFGQCAQARRKPAARHLLPRGAGGRRAGRAPAGPGGRTRVPRRQEGRRRARRQGVVGRRGRRGGVQGADAGATGRADRAGPRARRGTQVRREHEGELLLLPLPDALHALPTGRRRVPDRGSREGAGRGRRRLMTERYPKPIVDFLRGEPTPEQWTAISWPLEPCVVVAGAGSGKTSVMAARVIYLAMVATGAWPADHGGVMPGNALCLTFTNKATENLILKMRRALRTLGLDESEEPEISNYHAFAAQVLERHGMLIGLEPGQRVLS